MTITDATRKATEVVDRGQLLSFKNEVIVAEALKFCETHIWSAPARRSGDGALDSRFDQNVRVISWIAFLTQLNAIHEIPGLFGVPPLGGSRLKTVLRTNYCVFPWNEASRTAI